MSVDGEFTDDEITEHRAKLCEALLSGDYEQAFGRLRNADADRYCCLGVACVVFHDVTGKGEWDTSKIEDEFTFGADQRWTSMPRGVALYYGINQAQQDKLASMNDSAKAGFDEIAETIRTMPIKRTER